jgi:hypothetical protein
VLIFRMQALDPYCDGIAVDIIHADRVDIYNNTLTGVPVEGIRTAGGGEGAVSSDIDIFNTIVQTSGSGDWYNHDQAVVSSFDSDHNLFWNSDRQDAHFILDYDRVDLSAWRDITGQDLQSKHAPPRWIDSPQENDYYTRAGSAARDSGLLVHGVPYCGPGPDIGFRESGCP